MWEVGQCLPPFSKWQGDLDGAALPKSLQGDDGGAGKCQGLLFHPAQMSLSWGGDSPMRGFPPWPSLNQEPGSTESLRLGKTSKIIKSNYQQEGDVLLWLVQHPEAGKEGGTGSILPQLRLHLGWEEEPLLLSLQTQ